jgi:phenylacetate-coenzyme A ligase PaaK-like adenylate-forming protein
MASAFDSYNKFCPEFVIGFSASVLSFCRMNERRKNELKKHPKSVLCTAGPLSESEIEEIRLFFQAPVSMEYGSAECGVMAYTKPNENTYKIFWDTHLLQGIKDDMDEVQNIVTRLIPCYVPLIRYDIGDYLEIEKGENLNSIIEIKTVKGRPSDIVRLADGTSFFGALIGDCIKQVDGAIANQLHAFQNVIRIDIIAMRQLNGADFSLVKQRMLTVVPGLENFNVVVKQVDSLQKTVGGKTPLIVRHEYEM